MNVIVVTPLYYIKDRPKLFHDSNCVHYLLKYWPKDVNIYVFQEYHAWAKHWKRLLDKKERNYFKNGFCFEESGIKVNIIEIPIFPKQKKLLKFQKNKMSKYINNYLKKNKIKPNIAIFHQPSYYCSQYIEDLNINCNKIGILHYSDVLESIRNNKFDKELAKFDRLYTRSTYIRDFFNRTNHKRVEEEIIFSGAPFSGEVKNRDFQKVEKFNVLYVGKLIKRKNADLLIKSISKIGFEKINKLTIIGEGKEYKRLKKLVNKLSINNNVQFISRVSREEVLEYMDKNDIFAMPSIGETVGLVYLEAMSRGCITIGTEKEGIDGVIKSGINGYLVTPNDEKSLTKVLKEIVYSNPNKLNKISKLAISTSKEFDEKVISEKYYDIIKKYMEGEKTNEQL